MKNESPTTPAVNVDGTPMINGTYVDAQGKPFGVTNDDSTSHSIQDDLSLNTIDSGYDDCFDSGFDSDSSFCDSSFDSDFGDTF